MSHPKITPTGEEIKFAENELIVTKTDLRGVLTYANEVFIRISGFSEAELVGQAHNIIRHPDMPRCVFKTMWETLKSEREIFVYVVNLAKNGGHYWVHAHVTPSRDLHGNIVGYHSNRRVPYPDALAKIIPFYAELLKEEQRHSDPRAGMEASSRILEEKLAAAGMDFNHFIFSLSEFTRLESSI